MYAHADKYNMIVSWKVFPLIIQSSQKATKMVFWRSYFFSAFSLLQQQQKQEQWEQQQQQKESQYHIYFYFPPCICTSLEKKGDCIYRITR